MQSGDEAALGRLCGTVAALYRAGAGDAAAGPMLSSAAAALLTARPASAPPRLLPAGRLLAGALDGIASPALQPVAAAVRAARHLFHWRQNPNYHAADIGADFMAGYGYVEFLGPKESMFHSDVFRIGLLVLGPGLHYPPHRHPAEEVYHPLTSGTWRRGDEVWRAVPPGDAIHHQPMIEHETRSGASTLLALYCWGGDTATEARLSA